MAGGLQPSSLRRTLLQSDNFPERAIGNLGISSDLALLIRESSFSPPKSLVLLRLWISHILLASNFTHGLARRLVSVPLNCSV